MENMEPIISITHFKMRFGKTEVIKDLSFEVKRGETFGFLGSNGSGKTTTIRALLGIYQPTAGELLVGGKPYSVSSGIKLGYLPEERGLYKKEPVIDIMTYFGQLKGMSRLDARQKSLDFLKRVDLLDKAKTRLDKLSGGQQQKVQLGITVIDNPELLILDEPTKGFDPVNRRLLMEIIEEHQTKGATVVMITHQMEEVERLCDRILLLKDVIRFEVVRALKKKSFWILAISFPLMFAAIFGMVFLSNQATNDAAEKLKNQSFSIAITDESKMVKPQLIAASKATEINPSDKQNAIDRVKNGQLDAYIYYPKNLDQQSIEVYGKDVGIFDNGRYGSLASSLLATSVRSDVNPAIQKIIQGKINSTSTIYRDGKIHDSVQEMILPGIFLILFYFLITFFGNQMLTSTTEEKENRVIEMILTTIEARTLIVGKIISLIVLAIVQGLLVVLPVLIGYLFFHDQLKLPSVDLSSLPIDPLRIGIGFLAFASSFMMFTGLLVAIGAAVPTAKEAGSFFGVVMILLFGPLYAVSMFISMPNAPLVKFLSLFPLTSPIPLMLRNAAGNLGISEAVIGIALLAVSAAIIIAIAVRIFRFGALEYNRKLSAKEIFARK